MLLPVWLSTWQLDCCLSDVVLGEPWDPVLVAHEVTVAPVTSFEVMARARPDGAVEFRGLATRHLSPEAVVDVGGSIVDAGVIRFYSQAGVAGWVYGTATLHHDAHGGTDDIDDQEVSVTGIVQAIVQDERRIGSSASRRGDSPLVITLELSQAAAEHRHSPEPVSWS